MTTLTVGFLLNRTLDVHRPTTTDDGAGGQETTWQQVGTEPARVSQPSASEREVAAREEAGLTHQVYLRPNADVRRGDELRDSELTLEVIGTVAPSKPVYLRADCTSRQAERA